MAHWVPRPRGPAEHTHTAACQCGDDPRRNPTVPIRSSKHPWHPVQGRAECVLGPSHDICRSALGGVCCSPHFTDGGTEAQRGESQAEVIEGAWGRAGLKPWPAESQAPVFNPVVTVAPTCGEGEKGWPVLAAGVGSLTRAQTCFPCPGLHSSIVQARARPRVLARPTCPLPPRRHLLDAGDGPDLVMGVLPAVLQRRDEGELLLLEQLVLLLDASKGPLCLIHGPPQRSLPGKQASVGWKMGR